MYAEYFNTAEGYGLLGGFNSVFVCDDGTSVAKQVDFPNGWDFDTNLSFKVLFKNGHNCANASTPMTLNGVAVVVNKYGTLIPLPIHEMDDSGTPIYKSLQPNTILEMYYTNDYDGADTPAYVVIGNPIVLSSTDYTIYANGQIEQDSYSTEEVNTGKKWIDGKPIYRKVSWMFKNGTHAEGVTQSGNSYSGVLPPNIEYIVDTKVIVKRPSTTEIDVLVGTGQGFNNGIVPKLDTNTVYFYAGGYVPSYAYAIFEYTKTTD